MRIFCLMMICLLSGAVNIAAAQEATGDAAAAESSASDRQVELEQQFAEKLTGATLLGSFTVLGEEDGTLRQDRYQLETVKKLRGDLWLFEARIQYEDRDVKIPLSLRVLWAGETPVITLDKIFVPGLGTYSARVLFHEDQYAGTWSGGTHGGQMFGTIERGETETNAEHTEETPSDATE